MRRVIMPFKMLIMLIWNIGKGIDQLLAACLGFNPDWTLSAAAGWLEYKGNKFGVAAATVINVLAFVFTFQWQHCRRAYLEDQYETPHTIWGCCWKWAKE